MSSQLRELIMANGFHGEQKDWEQLEKPLKRLDSILEKFTSAHRLVLTKNERNWPDRTIQWGDHPKVIIQVFLESEKESTYTMWVSASDERSRSEYWKHKTLLKSAPIDVLEQQLQDLLKKAHTTAIEWIGAYDGAG